MTSFVACFLVLLVGCSTYSQGISNPGAVDRIENAATAPSAIDALDRIAQESWEQVLESDNVQRDAAGLPFVGIKDIDLTEAERDAAIARIQIAALDTIDSSQLDPDREITRQFLLKLYGDQLARPENWIYDFAITPYSGVLPLSGLVEYASKRPLESSQQREEWDCQVICLRTR